MYVCMYVLRACNTRFERNVGWISSPNRKSLEKTGHYAETNDSFYWPRLRGFIVTVQKLNRKIVARISSPETKQEKMAIKNITPSISIINEFAWRNSTFWKPSFTLFLCEVIKYSILQYRKSTGENYLTKFLIKFTKKVYSWKLMKHLLETDQKLISFTV